MTRGAAALTVVFVGLASAFAGFSLVAVGRGAAAAGAAVLGLVLVAAGVLALPSPVRPPGEDLARDRGASAPDA